MVPRLVALARADVLERTRRFSFLVTLAAALAAGYAFLPPQAASYVTLRLGDHRGVYNSAWVGAAISLLTSAFLGLIGFYLVRDTVGRDRRTGVGPLLAATPLSTFRYLLSKALSNWFVLGSIALAVALSGAVTQWVRAEDRAIELGGLLSPFLGITLPALAFVAALAVLFECLPGLRGGGGNVAYFFFWGLGLSASSLLSRGSGLDFAGMGAVLPAMERACAAAFPDFQPGAGNFAIGINIKESGAWHLSTFVWPGIDWSAGLIAARAFWLLAASGVVGLATLAFDRFAAAPALPRAARRRAGARSDPDAEPAFAEHYTAPSAAPRGGVVARLGRLTMNELRLLLRGPSRWWYVGLAGFWIAALATPLETARLRVLPLLWLWPVLAWSSLGMRERLHGTDAILFSAPRPLALQLPASWLAGALLALLSAAPIGIRVALAGDLPALGGWLAGAAFVPALALALGVWTGGSRAFEALYTALWYMGPLQPVAPLDFMAASRGAIESGMPAIYAGLTVVLLAASFLGRRWQLRR